MASAEQLPQTLQFAHRGSSVRFAPTTLTDSPTYLHQSLNLDVCFTGGLMMRPGTPFAENAKLFRQHVRMQLARHQQALEQLIGEVRVPQRCANKR
jgi:hypothetical protein